MQNDLMTTFVACEQAVATNPRSAVAQRNLGLVLDQLGRQQEAIAALKAALFLAPRDVTTLASLASVYNKTKEFERAVKACQTALDVDPENIGALGNLGSALRRLQRYADAAQAYETALAIEPDSAPLWLNLGNLRLDTEENDVAGKAFQQAIRIDPKNADAHANLGEAYRRLGQGDMSISAFQTAIKHNPKHVLAHLNLGIALSQFGFLQEAVAVLVRALPISGEDPKVLSHLGTCLKDLGEVDKAIRALRRAIAKPEVSDEALMKLATFPLGSLTDDIVHEIKVALTRLPSLAAGTPVAKFAEAGYLRHAGEIDASFALIRKANQQVLDDHRDTIASYEVSCARALARLRAWEPCATQTPALGLTPLFILGPSRSGKSTLEHLIDSSPEVARFFEGVWSGGYRFHTGDTGEGIVPPQRLEASFAARFQKHLSQNGVRFALYTNPHWIMNIELVIDLIPDARFVVVKRDRIDVAAEIFATHYAQGNIYSYDPASLMRYLDWYDAMLDAVNDKVAGKIMSVTSLDIAQDQTGVIEKLSAHLGVTIDTQGMQATDFVARPSVYRDHFQEFLAAQKT